MVYFVDLQTTNGADVELYNRSRPILLDVALPIGGSVKHGDNFKTSASFQDSTTHMKGIIQKVAYYKAGWLAVWLAVWLTGWLAGWLAG